MYGSERCFWCVKAKNFFKENNIDFEEVDVNLPENREKTMEAVKATGQSGIPIIKIDGEWLVGFDEGRIRELLKLK